MLAKAVYHDKWIKENLEPRAVRQLSKWLSADCSISVDIYQRVSLLLCVSGLQWWQGQEWDYLFGCAEEWVMLEQFILPPSVSLFQKEKLGMEILTLARRMNHLLYSVQQLSKSHKKYRPKRIWELFFSVYFFLLSSTCVCVLKIQKKGMWEVKRDTYHESWIVLPLTIRCIYFQTFLYACIIFKKQGWELFCSCFEACWVFFPSISWPHSHVWTSR